MVSPTDAPLSTSPNAHTFQPVAGSVTDPAARSAETVLEVSDLAVEFRTERGWVRVVDGVDLTVGRGETVGLVGESGSGKTVTSLAAMGLLPRDQHRIPVGSIRLEG